MPKCEECLGFQVVNLGPTYLASWTPLRPSLAMAHSPLHYSATATPLHVPCTHQAQPPPNIPTCHFFYLECSSPKYLHSLLPEFFQAFSKISPAHKRPIEN